MERPTSDTQPMPVVETVATPVVPPPLPVAEPVALGPGSGPRTGRDLTPLILGLLAVAAVVALTLSLVALGRREQPAPIGPPGSDAATTTLPSATAPPAPTAAPAEVTVTAPRLPVTTTVRPATTVGQGGKGGNGGRSKDD